MASLNNIKGWFKTGFKPTQQQFEDTWDSFWHKDENIPVANIDGIDNLLNQKANKSVVDNHLTDASAHSEKFSTKEDKNKKGQAGGYVPLDEFIKIAADYLRIVDDLVTGGTDRILSAQQGVELQSQINQINILLQSNDVNLDNVQELVDAIKTIQTSLSTILVNDLTTGGITKALTAEQGKQLKQLIDTLNSSIVDLTSVQTISGAKTFTKSITIMGTSLTPFRAWSAGGGIEYGSQWLRSTNMFGSMLRIFLGTTRNDGLEKNISFPDKNGTILVEDGTGITCAKFIKAGGTASEFLKADGSTSTIVNATGDATFVNQIVSKPDGTLGFESKTTESTTVYTQADCTVDTSLVNTFKFLALKKGRELIINIEIELKSTAPTDNVYRDLVTLPAGISFSKLNVVIGQRWQTNNEVSTLILETNKIKYFGMNQPKLAYAPTYFNATIIID